MFKNPVQSLESRYKAAGGGVARIAPGRAVEAKSPKGAFAGREAWRKQESDRRASKTSANCRQKHAERLRRPLTIINRYPTPLRAMAITPCRAIATPLDVGLLLHRGFAAEFTLSWVL